MRGRLVEVCVDDALIVPKFEGQSQVATVFMLYFHLDLLVMVKVGAGCNPGWSPRASHTLHKIAVDWVLRV